MTVAVTHCIGIGTLKRCGSSVFEVEKVERVREKKNCSYRERGFRDGGVANVRKAEFRKREEEKARWRVRLFMEDIIFIC
jgi:hypothetical protein